jgi:hypothetical protein
MDHRPIAKIIVKSIIMYASQSLITKTLVATVPVTQKFHIADLTGTAGGWYIAEALKPQTDQFVEDIFAWNDNRN